MDSAVKIPWRWRLSSKNRTIAVKSCDSTVANKWIDASRPKIDVIPEGDVFPGWQLYKLYNLIAVQENHDNSTVPWLKISKKQCHFNSKCILVLTNVATKETASTFFDATMKQIPPTESSKVVNGHLKDLNWRYLPHIRPIAQVYVREYPQKILPYILNKRWFAKNWPGLKQVKN